MYSLVLIRLILRRSNTDKATDAAAGPLGRRIHRLGNHRGHIRLERVLFGMLSCLVALLFAAPRPSSADVLTKMNLGKAVGGGRPFEPLLPKEQLNRGDVDVDVDSNRYATRGNAFEFDIDGSIDDEEGNSVSFVVRLSLFDRMICVWVHRHRMMCTPHLMVARPRTSAIPTRVFSCL